jgi:NAD(P)H dehydrogenase (quinone)
LSLAVEHVATEKNLKESGLTYTILRNGWYTENYTGSIGGALAGGAFIGSAGDGKIASAARIDFAEAAATVLATEGHDGKVYELAGDTSYTLTDLAAEISAQTGKTLLQTFQRQNMQILTSFGLPEFLHKLLLVGM